MTILEKCQIIPYLAKSCVDYTPYQVCWVPGTPKFVLLGQTTRGTGVLEIFELDAGAGRGDGAADPLKSILRTEKSSPLKCGTFGASQLLERRLATGDFDGKLAIYDIEKPELPFYSVQAHDQVVNCIDGCGGLGVNTGPPEVATGSRDGCVKVFDVRQKNTPVANITPAPGETSRETWTVAFGNSYNDAERMIAAGYENGDVKMFDLRNMSLAWECNVKNGVCSLEFDRKDIPMNKLLVSTLEATFQVFDMRTKHPKEGYASVVEKHRAQQTTVWTCKHSPHNRDIFVTSAGNGSLNLYRYLYPNNRVSKPHPMPTGATQGPSDPNDLAPRGVPGTVELLNTGQIADQPICSFSWSPDKQGLFACTAFDQTVRVGLISKLQQY